MTLIKKPAIIASPGNIPKTIEEFIGRVNSETDEVSIARMTSPAGWQEPGQRPDFNEYTVVLKGVLHVKTEKGELDVRAGEAFMARSGEWVQYSSPDAGGAEYIAVCAPAFSPATVHRDDE
jgi:mannose-6-phosphate isomerase-like protein (cupin superfamily)